MRPGRAGLPVLTMCGSRGCGRISATAQEIAERVSVSANVTYHWKEQASHDHALLHRPRPRWRPIRGGRAMNVDLVVGGTGEAARAVVFSMRAAGWSVAVSARPGGRRAPPAALRDRPERAPRPPPSRAGAAPGGLRPGRLYRPRARPRGRPPRRRGHAPAPWRAAPRSVRPRAGRPARPD